jgi:hypothetical protein
MFWRGLIWEINSSVTPGAGPEWVSDVEEFSISRDEAQSLFPSAFEISDTETVKLWDPENLEGIIAGTYPPPIPERYLDFPDLIELVTRFERGESLLQEYFTYSERRFDEDGDPMRLPVWLERLSPDELADMYFVFKATQKGYVRIRKSKDGESRHMRELETALRIIVNWRNSQSSGNSN